MVVCSRREVSRLGGESDQAEYIYCTQNITLYLGCIELLKIRELFNENIH